MSRSGRFVYRLVRVLLRGFGRVWFRFEVEGLENVPETGGYVLAPGGHRSILDTPLVSLTGTRILRYMGAENYFEIPGLGWFLRSVGGFPVERSTTDRAALRLAEQILTGGEPLVVFAEGTRQEGPIVEELKEGAAFLALRAQVPIVPVGIGGAQRAMGIGARWVKPRKIVVVVGPPMGNAERAPGERVKRSAVRALTAELHQELQRLFDMAQTKARA